MFDFDPRDSDRDNGRWGFDRDREGRDRSDPRDRDRDREDLRDVFMRDLNLPRGLDRERVHVHEHDYELRGSETRTLSIVGSFRVVPAEDLHDALDRPADSMK